MNWLTLIETVVGSMVEKGWHAHHKHMISDWEFLDWAQAWHAHDWLLRTCFMLKHLILDNLVLPMKNSSNVAK